MNNPDDLTVHLLRKIEAVSASLDMRLRWITDDINSLVNIPDWETKAEDTLNQATDRAERTLHTLIQAGILLRRKRPQVAAE